MLLSKESDDNIIFDEILNREERWDAFSFHTGILLVEHLEQTLGFIVLEVFSSLALMPFALLFSYLVENLFD